MVPSPPLRNKNKNKNKTFSSRSEVISSEWETVNEGASYLQCSYHQTLTGSGATGVRGQPENTPAEPPPPNPKLVSFPFSTFAELL